MRYKLYNTNFTGARVAIPDLGIRLEPGGETDITDEDVRKSVDLGKAIAAKLVTIRENTLYQFNADVSTSSCRIPSPRTKAIPVPQVAEIYNIRKAVFIKMEELQ